ncbi:MAG: Gfo/Idh/MocA family oxidoreductase [bacterium]
MLKIKVGLYGSNGHQIQESLVHHPLGELTAVAAFPPRLIPTGLSPREYSTLDELLLDKNVQLISLCSPRRADQARDAIRCMEAGKHVYAEKPSALTEDDLNALITTSHKTGMHYREMSGTLVTQPYKEMRTLIRSGAIGTVVQVLSQKSYPWTNWRPSDETIDGGIAMQAGIYSVRFVEHIAGVKITSLQILETGLGNPLSENHGRTAVSMLMQLENGGVASAVCNYLNPLPSICWAYEFLRIFGTLGMIESNSETNRTRLLVTGSPPREVTLTEPSDDYFTLFLQSLCGGPVMPISLEDELSPTRWVIRAKAHLHA